MDEYDKPILDVLGADKVYSPYDVITLLKQGQFGSYWFATATPGFLVEILRDRGLSPVMLNNALVSAESLSDFDLAYKDVKALMFQTGYFTITDAEMRNNEVMYRLLIETLRTGDTQNLCVLLDDLLAGIPYQRHTSGEAAKYEAYYMTAFQVYFEAQGADITNRCINTEVKSSTLQGHIDIVVSTDQRIWLFEFKVPRKGEPTGEAIRQLTDRDYAEKIS